MKEGKPKELREREYRQQKEGREKELQEQIQ